MIFRKIIFNNSIQFKKDRKFCLKNCLNKKLS